MNIIKKMLRHYFKVWNPMQRIIAIVLLLVLAAILFSAVGLPKEIQETCQAAVFTQSGEVMSCELEARGEVTRYPLRRKIDIEHLSLWAENRLVVEIPSYISSYSNRFTGILYQEEKAVVAELDLKILFPEEEKQRCVIALPAADRDTALDLLKRAKAEGYYKSGFDWFLTGT